jgi:signal transduction histidine kinase
MQFNMVVIFFFYGLAFFCMGLAITLEAGRGADARLRHGLRALALFGLFHGAHEWVEMFEQLGILPGKLADPTTWQTARIAMLEFSFLLLAASGTALLPKIKNFRRASLVVPMVLATIWGLGLIVLRGYYTIDTGLWAVADVWTRYSVAVPSAILACLGLLGQRQIFRRAGMPDFGQAALIAAIAFAWYGVVGQTFTPASPLPPSNIINQDLFAHLFGFPVQLLRAGAAVVSAYAVMRFIRAFEVETKRKIAELQAEQLHDAQRREAQRGDLLRQVVSAQEAERQRIARELHDETGQALTAIGLGLRGISNTLRVDIDRAAANLRQLEGLVARSLDELQRLIADLRPSHLDDLGLPAALRWYAGEVEARVPLHVNVAVSGKQRPIDSVMNTTLFRVAQEALTNVVKHAEATQAQVKLTYTAGGIHLQVADDGRGFDMATLVRGGRPTWGLTGMQERAALLGGQFSITANSPQGTCIEVIIPYQHAPEANHEDTLITG